jgi:lysophospholipase L1-like esterase
MIKQQRSAAAIAATVLVAQLAFVPMAGSAEVASRADDQYSSGGAQLAPDGKHRQQQQRPTVTTYPAGTTSSARGGDTVSLTSTDFCTSAGTGQEIPCTVDGAIDTRNTGTGDLSDSTLFGREYLYAFTKKLMTTGAVPTIVLAGDSTTAGDGIIDPNYFLQNLLRQIITRNFRDATIYNDGVSGSNTEQWRTTYLTGQLARTPDLMIIRYGINDGAGNRAGFETSLRSALATIRASRAVSSLAILLMSPNSTNDTPNGRDETWYKIAVPIIRKAARDYQCTFLDTYTAFRDSTNAGAWMDDPYGDGRHIHPRDALNLVIANQIAEAIFPHSVRAVLGKGLRLASDAGAEMFFNGDQISINRNPMTGAVSDASLGSAAVMLPPSPSGGDFQVWTSPAAGGSIVKRMDIDKDGNLCFGASCTPETKFSVAQSDGHVFYFDGNQLSVNRNPLTGSAADASIGSGAFVIAPGSSGSSMSWWLSPAAGGGVAKYMHLDKDGNLCLGPGCTPSARMSIAGSSGQTLFADGNQLSWNRNPLTGAAPDATVGSALVMATLLSNGSRLGLYTSDAAGGGVGERLRIESDLLTSSTGVKLAGLSNKAAGRIIYDTDGNGTLGEKALTVTDVSGALGTSVTLSTLPPLALSSTGTITETVTSTDTSTITNTGTNTGNGTGSGTGTGTSSQTVTVTVNGTATNTGSATATVTARFTGTATGTSYAGGWGNLASYTQTSTNTGTRTVTVTASNSTTLTQTYTATGYDVAPSETVTITSAATGTLTGTIGGASTAAVTGNATGTVTGNLTGTVTGTGTGTGTGIGSGTPTATATQTSTFAVPGGFVGTYGLNRTATKTYVHPRTATWTVTGTGSWTGTWWFEQTATFTYTDTATKTVTASGSVTAEGTTSLTGTRTATGTVAGTVTGAVSGSGSWTTTGTTTSTSTSTQTTWGSSTNAATGLVADGLTISGGGSTYTLPIAGTSTVTGTNTSTLGGVKVGPGITRADDGTISVSLPAVPTVVIGASSIYGSPTVDSGDGEVTLATIYLAAAPSNGKWIASGHAIAKAVSTTSATICKIKIGTTLGTSDSLGQETIPAGAGTSHYVSLSSHGGTNWEGTGPTQIHLFGSSPSATGCVFESGGINVTLVY